MLENELFWCHQGDGLALFLSPGAFRSYRLPLYFGELVVVNDRYHLKPLLPLLTGDGRFYVLALSQNEVRLLGASRYSVDEVELGEDVPESLADALKCRGARGRTKRRDVELHLPGLREDAAGREPDRRLSQDLRDIGRPGD